MQKTCSRESYALSLEEEMFLYQSKKRVPVLKKTVMISLLPERAFKKRVVVSTKEQLNHLVKNRSLAQAGKFYLRLAESN